MMPSRQPPTAPSAVQSVRLMAGSIRPGNDRALGNQSRRAKLYDRLLRKSFHAGGQDAVFLIRAGLLVVQLLLSVSGFRLVLARGWHEARLSMRTTGAHHAGTSAVGNQCCPRSCMRAVHASGCTPCFYTDSRITGRGNPVRLPCNWIGRSLNWLGAAVRAAGRAASLPAAVGVVFACHLVPGRTHAARRGLVGRVR